MTYKGGTIPVEGVSFKVDGVTVMDGKNNIIKTDNNGQFTISVPVGTHEVKAELTNHTFENDGRITSSDGADLNYQDMLTGLKLYDNTTVRYIGRVAGGTIQEDYEVGHSLSKNNLADDIKVTLTYQNEAYQAYDREGYDLTYTHAENPYSVPAKQNTANFKDNTITIYPNAETGEFFVDVLPIKYQVKVIVPGYDNVPGSDEQLDFSDSFISQYSENEYVDSVSVAGSYINRIDSVMYNKLSKFIVRVKPSILVKQVENGSEIDYFGKDKVRVTTADSQYSYDAVLWDAENGYALGMPAFEKFQNVTFNITTAEIYPYKDSNGRDKEGVEEDKVAVPDATLSFGGDLAYGTQEELTTDENGYAQWSFQVNVPELTAAKRSLSMTMTYGDSDNPTSINWDGAFDAVVIGSVTKGKDFLTEGPDQLMFVLRDPPGSNSYSYLEKGVTVSRTSSYTGEVLSETSVTATTKLGTRMLTFAGFGAGTIQDANLQKETVYQSRFNFMIGGTNSDYSEFTTTTRFETSSDPLYVGSNGDLYVGYSTNIGLGSTDNISIVKQSELSKFKQDVSVIIDSDSESDDNMVVIKTEGINLSQRYKTLFVYPQVYIENTMIPKLEETRDALLHDESEDLNWQKLADSTGGPVFVSKLPRDHVNFGRSNSDKVFGKVEDAFDGQSYKIYYPDTCSIVTDSILVFNQSIERWKQHIANNEQQKVEAELINNVSFQAGANYEYSEGFTTTRTETQRFTLGVGGKFMTNTGATINQVGVLFEIGEDWQTNHGGEFTDEETANHCQGFVLSESGDDDYISVDICRESGYNKDDEYIKYKDMNSESTQFSTFIFKTKGGATSCPYEGEEKTRYYLPGQKVLNESTVQIEVPEISVEKDFIDNVPSGKSAYFTLYLRNNSQAQEDGWFDLRIDDESNPDGAQLYIDGAPLGNSGGRAFLVPAGSTLTKTLEVRKGKVMNYDNLRLLLQSQCQCDPTDFLDNIFDDVTFSVHFTPSATDVNIKRPSNNWTYNTKLPTEDVNGVEKHYMEITLDGFDVNYDGFNRVMLQYKAASGSDDDWTTLMSYYNDQEACDRAILNGMNAEMIKSSDAGTITYRLFLDDLPDQNYDIRAVGTSIINDEEIYNYSDVHSGIKDMYNPRLFGSAQPANGVLTINDEIRLNFNETIADGLLTYNNFEVVGVRNGAQTDHSVSVSLDGENDVLTTEFTKNWQDKDLTVEMWVLPDKAQDAVLFSQGDANSAIELGITKDYKLKVKVGDKTIVSNEAFVKENETPFESWSHVAMTYNSKTNEVSAFYNFVEYISNVETNGYEGKGSYVFGASINGTQNYAGKMHNARIWDKLVSSGRLQTNSLTMYSGSESNLIAYYPMNEARGTMLTDKAQGNNLTINGGSWVVPEGRAVTLDGNQMLKISSGSTCVIDSSMDYTLELWFKAKEGQKNATIVSNGRGDGGDFNHSFNNFALGFDEDGSLAFSNNGTTATCTGDFADNNWHHVAVAVSRISGRAQIYLDGELNTYFDASDLGGLASAYINLGARSWSPDTVSTVTVDNYFKGQIDEFRLWNLYRSESIISENFTKQLSGTEKGLMAYYPFETYSEYQGLQELKFTLKDAKVQKDASLVVPEIEIVGEGNVETSASSPVKTKDPVSSLLYDFVVNNDALIINLNEPYDRIEKTIVTFTVDGVRDLNGNEILSPITWSAYIDRNQLKWTESSVSVTKKVNEEKEFTVSAKNSGGSIQHYTVENMPSWLDVTPSSGTIDPVSSVDIKFTINPSLNIGTYDEVIYLRNDNNVVEALQLTVKVEGEKPTWSVNPADYQYNMSIFGKMLINNIYSSDEEDILAAFNGSECVGICTNKYYKVNDMWYAMLTVYSNQAEASKDLEFRIWDASTGSIYIAEPATPIHFVNNDVIGSPSNPIVFNAKDTRVQQIELAEGWSWISVNVDNQNLNDINTLLSNYTWSSDDQLKSETDGFVSYSSKGWVGTLQGLNNKSMYMMRSSKAQRLDIIGAAIDTKTCMIDIIGSKDDGTARWNYISYLPSDNMTLKEALAGYEASEGDIVKSQTAMAMYDTNMGWIGSLEYMENGKGYMLQRKANSNATLQYPSKSAVNRSTLSTATRSSRSSESSTPVADYGRRYATNMTIVARVEGVEVLDGDRLAAYVNGECRGEAQATTMSDGTTLFLMTINGESVENVDVVLQRGENIEAVAKSAVTYGANDAVGTTKSPMVIRFVDEGENVMVYPTPFNSVLTIKATAEANAKVDVYITDVAGARVAQWLDCNDNGLVEIVWDVDDNLVVDGVYIVNVIINGKAHAVKTVKR
ncbi:MAG: LamG-like jellyroll fold domain-containing protein [Muribaculaceae bacterium]